MVLIFEVESEAVLKAKSLSDYRQRHIGLSQEYEYSKSEWNNLFLVQEIS